RRAGDVAAGRVADHAGEIANQKNDVVAEFLQLPELVKLHGVAQVQVGPRRIEALLDAQGLAAADLLHELGLDDQLVRAALEYGELSGDVERVGFHGIDLLQSASRASRRRKR